MNTKKFTIEETKEIAAKLGIEFNSFSIDEFMNGINVELEHGARDPDTNVTNDDPVLTGKIALAHLKEFPDYYTRLKKMETEADEFWGKNK